MEKWKKSKDDKEFEKKEDKEDEWRNIRIIFSRLNSCIV
jgi:hypothetical protein